MYGWAGTILWVDLSTGSIEKRPLKKRFAEQFLGGRGFNSKIIYDNFDTSVTDAYSPENMICISSGLMGGTLSPAGHRFTVSVARNPVTGVFGDGNGGGHFGPELKYAGYDTIVITGASPKPVYILILDDDIQIRDASHLWGKDVWETDEALKREVGDPLLQSLVIGPAGENLVAFACPIANLSRAPGGGGTGAVFGSKKLKAVAVRGTKSIKVADPERFKKTFADRFARLLTQPLYKQYSTQGTTCLMGAAFRSGYGLGLNWQAKTVDTWEKVDGPAFVEQYSTKTKGCFSCPVHCSHFYRVDDGEYAGTYGEGPEYEATCGFGSRVGNDNLASVLHINTLYNQLGLCVVQGANAGATAMHLWQDGVIDEKDTGGLNFEWGNHRSLVELTKQIAARRGFGAVFADGILQAMGKIAAVKGIDPAKLERYVIHTKGMTYSSVDFRSRKGRALGYATATRGGDHLRSSLGAIEIFAHVYDSAQKITEGLCVPLEIAEDWVKRGIREANAYEGKSYLVKYYQELHAASDALEVCKFASGWYMGLGPMGMAEMMSPLIGKEYTWQDVLRCGERIYAVEYAMQRRYGMRRKDDTIPDRFFEEPNARGDIIERDKFEKMLLEYYDLCGYDREGIPTSQKLRELDLADVDRDLEKRGVRGTAS